MYGRGTFSSAGGGKGRGTKEPWPAGAVEEDGTSDESMFGIAEGCVVVGLTRRREGGADVRWEGGDGEKWKIISMNKRAHSSWATLKGRSTGTSRGREGGYVLYTLQGWAAS